MIASLGRPAFRVDEPKVSATKKTTPAERYEQVSKEHEEEAEQLRQEIEAIESILRQDKEKLRQIKAQGTYQPLASLKGNKDLLPAQRLLQLQTNLATLRARRDSAVRVASEYRSRAERWKSVLSNPDKTKVDVFSRLDAEDCEALEMVAFLAENDADAAKLLGRKAKRMFLPLIQAATLGNPVAAEELATIAIIATRAVTELATRNPSIFKGIAPKNYDWPVLASRKKNFHDKPALLLEQLQQGYEAPIAILPESGWTIDDGAGQVAWKLWHYVNHSRTIGRAVLADNSWGWQLDEFQSAAAALKAFSPESWSDWWQLADEALCESYPILDENPTLRKIGEGKRKPGRQLSSRTLPQIRSAAKAALKEKFASFAGVHRQ